MEKKNLLPAGSKNDKESNTRVNGEYRTNGEKKKTTARRKIKQSFRLPTATAEARVIAGFHNQDKLKPLTQEEIGFLYIYSACQDKRLAISLAFGHDTDEWPAWKVYNIAQPILVRAELTMGDWRDAMRRHELTFDDLAAHLQRLLTCGNPHAEANALKLALMVGGLLDRGDHAPKPQGPGATFHFHMHHSDTEKPVHVPRGTSLLNQDNSDNETP